MQPQPQQIIITLTAQGMISCQFNVQTRPVANMMIETAKQDILAELMRREHNPQIEIAPATPLLNGR